MYCLVSRALHHLAEAILLAEQKATSCILPAQHRRCTRRKTNSVAAGYNLTAACREASASFQNSRVCLLHLAHFASSKQKSPASFRILDTGRHYIIHGPQDCSNPLIFEETSSDMLGRKILRQLLAKIRLAFMQCVSLIAVYYPRNWSQKGRPTW